MKNTDMFTHLCFGYNLVCRCSSGSKSDVIRIGINYELSGDNATYEQDRSKE